MLMNNALGVNSLLATQKVKCKPLTICQKNEPVHIVVQIEGEGTESQPYVGVLYCVGNAPIDGTSHPGQWGMFNPADQKDSIITGGNEAEIEAGTHGGLLYTIDITVHGYAWVDTYDVANVKNKIITNIANTGALVTALATSTVDTDHELGVILSNVEDPAKTEFYIY